MNYVEELKKQGREEGREEALLRTTRELLRRDVPWSIITDATGIDEARFRRLEQQFDGRS